MQMLFQAGIPVHRAHPNRVYAFAKACGHFAKTDKLDSKLLERYASFISSEDVHIEVLDDTILSLESLRSVERGLEKNLHAYKCRIGHVSGKALEYVEKQIDFISDQLVEIQKDIEQIIKENAELQKKQDLLITYKGIGKKTANCLIAELPELGKVSAKQIASLVGVVPKTYESGTMIGKGHIHGGRFFIRKSLYMSALVAMCHNEKMKTFYERLRGRGKSAKVALVAIVRKIIICLNSMLKNNEIYS